MISFAQTGVLLLINNPYDDDNGIEKIQEYLESINDWFEKDLSFEFYTQTGYYINKHLIDIDDFSFTNWELIAVKEYLQIFEQALKFFYSNLEDIPYYNICYKGTNESWKISKEKIIEHLVSLYIDLIKTKNFLEKKWEFYEIKGVCIWGENENALKTLYEETKSIYVQDRDFKHFKSVFVTNMYINGDNQKINLIGTTEANFSYLLNEIKQFFIPSYQDIYSYWIYNNVTFKTKTKSRNRVTELLKISGDKHVSQRKKIDSIIKKVASNYFNEETPKKKHIILYTKL